MRQPEEAFEQLLLPALADITEPVVLLIDALDEADPPEEQRAGFDSAKATVKACGNAVLSALVSQLAPRLPANVKFILTTRPEACCHGIEGVLARTFAASGGVAFLQPDNVRAPLGAAPQAQAASQVLRGGVGCRAPGVSTLTKCTACLKFCGGGYLEGSFHG